METKTALYIVSVLCVLLWRVGGVLLVGVAIEDTKRTGTKHTVAELHVIKWLWPFIGIPVVLFHKGEDN